MSAYFSSKAISVVLLAVSLLLSGCGAREPKVITPPQDIAAVIEPFLKELAAGNKDEARAFVAVDATDEFDVQFAEDAKKLSQVRKLAPRFVHIPKTPVFGDNLDEATLVYAVKKDARWTTATIRVYRFPGKPYVINYWRVSNRIPTPVTRLNTDAKELQRTDAITNATIIGMSLLGLFGIALLVWMVRRKPHLLVPETAGETRRSASTVREPEE